MKIHKGLYLLLSILLIHACTSTEFDDPASELIQEETITKPTFPDTIIGTDGLVRGVMFGMSAAEVRGVETAKHDETYLDTNGQLMVRYVEEFSLETGLDVEYYFSEKEVLNKIALFVYCKDAEQQSNLYTELGKVFEKRNEAQVEINKVGNKENFNIELFISPKK